jgi:hypothetical protein
VVRLGGEGADRLVAIPVTLDLVAELVQPSTAVAVREVVGIVVLEGLGGMAFAFSFSSTCLQIYVETWRL